ncbi:unnamed protein product [Cyclocybe aegerita]|uniref:Uncharacterized protein n=1 Tax=Cyclocybe aegerita TaxID=1973307 RepID=A0A8S0XGU4_CYCAE|nr:unnamed protein product [Cyclocybe aegerita]
MLIVTRSDIMQPQFSESHASRHASNFLRNVLKTDVDQLAERLEGYVISGATEDRAPASPHLAVRMKQKEQIKIARDLVLNGLVGILRDAKVPEGQIPKAMNYKSYVTKIVEQYGVVLVGYPGDKGVVNPGELDAATLKELIFRLIDGRCCWKKGEANAPLLENARSSGLSTVEGDHRAVHDGLPASPSHSEFELAYPINFDSAPTSSRQVIADSPASSDVQWAISILQTPAQPGVPRAYFLSGNRPNPSQEI